DRTIEASLGYFINPLVSILLSAVFLKERLRALQKLAVLLAFIGVAWITWVKGVPPVLGLGLALTFGFYGLIRKTAPLGSLEGLTLESLLLTPLALAWLGWLFSQGELAFIQVPVSKELLLMAAGPITAIPLLLFASGVRRIPYSTSAIIQYVSPSMVFLIGVFAFNEPFTLEMLIGFLFIWSAVIIFLFETWNASRRVRNLARERAAKH
ncbi:EamA family transporter, partial [Sutterella sp.]|uniref:EamA family transporter n=1 Tax=Sutterella sp. TaxID=1981025 RepID=UPI0026E06305